MYEEFTGTVFSENSEIRKYVAESSHRIDEFHAVLFDLVIANAERLKQAKLLALKRREMMVATSQVNVRGMDLQVCKNQIASKVNEAKELEKSVQVLPGAQNDLQLVVQTVEPYSSQLRSENFENPAVLISSPVPVLPQNAIQSLGPFPIRTLFNDFLSAIITTLQLVLTGRRLDEELREAEKRFQVARDLYLKVLAEYTTLFDRDCDHLVKVLKSSKIIHWTRSQLETFVDLFDQEYVKLLFDVREEDSSINLLIDRVTPTTD